MTFSTTLLLSLGLTPFLNVDLCDTHATVEEVAPAEPSCAVATCYWGLKRYRDRLLNISVSTKNSIEAKIARKELKSRRVAAEKWVNEIDPTHVIAPPLLKLTCSPEIDDIDNILYVRVPFLIHMEGACVDDSLSVFPMDSQFVSLVSFRNTRVTGKKIHRCKAEKLTFLFVEESPLSTENLCGLDAPQLSNISMNKVSLDRHSFDNLVEFPIRLLDIRDSDIQDSPFFSLSALGSVTRLRISLDQVSTLFVREINMHRSLDTVEVYCVKKPNEEETALIASITKNTKLVVNLRRDN